MEKLFKFMDHLRKPWRKITDRLIPPASPELEKLLEDIKQGKIEGLNPENKPIAFDIHGPNRADIEIRWSKTPNGKAEVIKVASITPDEEGNLQISKSNFYRTDGKDWEKE